jgi:hypothetical protein
MRWAVYVTRIRKDEKAYMISVPKPEGKRPFEGPGNRWDIKIEKCVVLGHHTASSGDLMPRFQDNLSLSRLSCSETSVRNYHYSLSNNPEKRSSHPLSGRSLKTRILELIVKVNGGLDWIHLARDANQWRDLADMIPSFRVP